MTKRMFSMKPDFVDERTDVTPDGRLVISAPVGELSHFRVKNIRPDVAKIQEALNRFPVRDGGPQPALKVDSIVGPLTIAAIKRFQTINQLKSRDGIVDVDGITIALLRAGPEVIPQESVSRFIAEIPAVLAVVAAAEANLSVASSALNTPGSLFAGSAFIRLDRHFHSKGASERRLSIAHVLKVFNLVRTAIGHLPAGTIIADDEPFNINENAFMFTFEDGFNEAKLPKDKIGKFKGAPMDRVYITLKGRRMATQGFRYGMLHEMCHYVTGGKSGLPLADDQAYFHKEKPKYDALPNRLALLNADTYARFAFDTAGQTEIVL